MAKSKNKLSIQSIIKKLNNIDVNALMTSLQQFNIEDIKKIDISQLIRKTKRSPKFRPAIGILSASLLFTFLLFPSIGRLRSKFSKSKQYQFESNNLELIKKELEDGGKRMEKLSVQMSTINNSILKKDKLIFISKLLNETARKSNVEISSFVPIEIAKSSKLCKLSNPGISSKKSKRKSRSRKGRKSSARKGSFEANLYEVNLNSDYLNMMEFINIIQYYDVTIIPYCLEVTAQTSKKKMGSNAPGNNPTIITPLSESGIPIVSNNQINELGEGGSYGRVKSRLILKIPSHSK